MKEPSVSIQMIADSIPANLIGGQNIACGVIIADCGTLEPKLYKSSTEVLNEYTKSGKITRQTDETLIHAAMIADVMPVFLKRSFDDDGTRAGFAVLKQEVSTDAEVTTTTVTSGTNLVVKPAGEFSKVVILGTREVTTDKKDEKGNPIKEIRTYYDQVSYAYLTNSLGEETYLNFKDIVNGAQDFVINTGEQSEGTTLTVVFNSVPVVSAKAYISDKVTYIEGYFKNGEFLTYMQEHTISGFNPMSFKIQIDDKLYYNASSAEPTVSGVTLVAVEGITKDFTLIDVLTEINKQMKTAYAEYRNANSFRVFSLDPLAAFTGEGRANTCSKGSERLANADKGFTLFIYANSPSAVEFTGKVSRNTSNEELIDVTVVTATRTYEYSGSTDPEYVNAYGANQYIANVNDYDGIQFTIKVIPNSDGTYPASSEILNTPVIEFGAMKITTGKNNATRKAALEALCDVDNIKPAFLCPFGYSNNAYLTKLVTFGPKNWMFIPIGLYVDKDDPEAIIANKPAISSEYAIFLAPHDRSTAITDWVQPTSLEVAYLTKIQSNAAKSCEFAPMLGKENSALQLTKPSVIFRRSTREQLLDARIMSVISKTSEGVHYLNKNKCTGGDTVLSEDQNIRLACKINRDLDTLLEPIIGRYNTEETRSRVHKTITNYFKQNITNQVFSIEKFDIICDESNNTKEVRANNQLVVDLSVTYLNAIYDVFVYHRALNVASNNE